MITGKMDKLNTRIATMSIHSPSQRHRSRRQWASDPPCSLWSDDPPAVQPTSRFRPAAHAYHAELDVSGRRGRSCER
jgi:hypothetical protein